MRSSTQKNNVKTVKRAVNTGLLGRQNGFDTVYFILTLILVCFGAVMVLSASYAWAQNDYGDSFYWVKRHLAWVCLGLIAAVFCSYIPPDIYKKYAGVIFVCSTVLLALVPIIGKTVNGAKRWIKLGPIQIQPTEIMKLALVLFLSKYISEYVSGAIDVNSENLSRVKDTVIKPSLSERIAVFIREVGIPLGIIGLVCVLTVLEKHMSATIILFAIGIAVLFAGNVPFKWIGGMGVAGALGASYIIFFTDYTKARIDAWLHPEAYATGKGWQTLQSLYAIGSGGLFGVGLGNSSQKHMYLPEPQNDFIFAIVCEELGFIGGVIVIAMFAMLVWRGFVIALNAPDSFSRLVAMGITCKIAIQAALNMAVVTNTIPPTGISLPFLSYGGSALVILLCEVGVMLSISRYSNIRK